MLQLIAAGLALSFIRTTGRRVGWILMAAAILLMAVRRGITLEQSFRSDSPASIELYAESVALLVSGLMCAGVYQIGRFFREIRRDQSRLRDSESRYRSLYDDVSDGIVLADTSGRHLQPNPSALKMFGYSEQEFEKLEAVDLFVQEDLKEEPLEFASLREGKKLLKERRLRRKDGSIIYTEISSTMLATGQLVALIRDITSRHRAERALEESEAQLRAVLNSVFDAIVTVNRSGKVIECNRGTCSMFREIRERILGSEVFEFLPSLKDRWQSVGSLGDESEDSLRLELDGCDRLGRRFPVEVSVTLVRLEAEMQIVLAVRDLTRWKELQSHLVQSQKMDALGTLAGGVAHDFNNVLMVLLGNLEIALEDIDPDHVAHSSLQRAFDSAKRGKELVSQILTFSRKDEFEMSPVALGAVIKEALSLLQPIVPPSVQLRCDLDPDIPLILGDKTHLQQVILNLVSNAYQSYGTRPGRVDVACRIEQIGEGDLESYSELTAGTYLSVSVQDKGSGMSRRLRDRIFDPFFTTKKAGEGTGMGLSVVLSIIEQHGGVIEVESEEGQGSCFRVLLPVPAEKLVISRTPEAPFVRGEGQLVALIEDQESVMIMTRKLLERIGYQCEAFLSAHEGMAFVQENGDQVSVLITDLAMPEKDGLALIREIREQGYSRPIVLMTGNPSDVSERDLGSGGASVLLLKPFGLEELSSCLAQVLDAEHSDALVSIRQEGDG